MAPEVVFTAVDPAAAPDAAALIAELKADLDRRYAAWDTSGLPHYDPADFDPATGVFVIGYQEGEPVCCGAVRPPGEVKRMYVRPAHRGRGLGRRVLVELERHARRLGYPELVIETGTEQPEAMALYASAGYQPCPCWPPYDQTGYSRCYRKRI